jgi:hypothetical protein
MRFSVPQFIDVEDKIFGQLTLKQGIYVLGSVGISVAIFVKFGLIWAILFGAPFVFAAFLLAFVKIHGQPFINILYSATFYILKHKLYLWRKTTKKKVSEKKTETEVVSTTRPVSVGLSQSRLRELAWSLDTKNTFDDERDSKK